MKKIIIMGFLALLTIPSFAGPWIRIKIRIGHGAFCNDGGLCYIKITSGKTQAQLSPEKTADGIMGVDDSHNLFLKLDAGSATENEEYLKGDLFDMPTSYELPTHVLIGLGLTRKHIIQPGKYPMYYEGDYLVIHFGRTQ